jgi:chromate transport protein ChrA
LALNILAMANVESVTGIPEKSSSNVESNIEAALPTLPVEQSGPLQQYEDNSNVPKLSIYQIFWLFLTKFGIFAWGGPVAQIAIIKDYLVMKEEWITLPRFNRVFAVYQILPGPEAAELCMFFGCLAGGRIGGIAAGLGFILPGFILTLLASYLYIVFGLGNIYVDASFRALQPMVAAMVSYCLYCFWCLIDVIV